MGISDKKLVESFYSSGLYDNPEEINSFLHPEAELFWNSSAGFNKMDFSDIHELGKELSKSFETLRAEVSHLLRDKDKVVIRFTYYVRTVENPEEEIPMAHFMAIWEIKEAKMVRGY
jgi:hypothetical protein